MFISKHISNKNINYLNSCRGIQAINILSFSNIHNKIMKTIGNLFYGYGLIKNNYIKNYLGRINQSKIINSKKTTVTEKSSLKNEEFTIIKLIPDKKTIIINSIKSTKTILHQLFLVSRCFMENKIYYFLINSVILSISVAVISFKFYNPILKFHNGE